MDRQDNNLSKKIKRKAVGALLELMQSETMKKSEQTSLRPCDENSEGVEQRLSIPYVNRLGVPLAMDVFKPEAPEGTELPVIISIHGGGLCMGDRIMTREFNVCLARRGYLVFSVEYRLVPRATICEQFDDICAGMDVIGSMLPEYDVDFTRIFLVAESAGVFLAIYTAAMKYSKKLQEIIGYEPSRMVFKAVGLVSGMFYTKGKGPFNEVLSDQLYGEKREDPEFLRYMDPEHPEIVNNLPPSFLITGRGDFLNANTVDYHKVLKNSGKTTRLLYYGDEEVSHSYCVYHPNEEKAVDAIDRMLAWFEQQAANTSKKKTGSDNKISENLSRRIADGSVKDQKIWRFIREVNSSGDEQLDSVALLDGTRKVTYRRMFRNWERYAEVFTALGMTDTEKSRVAVISSLSPEPTYAMYALNMTGAVVSNLSFSDIMISDQWKHIVRREKISDLVISDIIVTPELLRGIISEKESLGLRNIILLHTRMGGPSIGPAELVYNEVNYHALKQMPGAVFMEDLLVKYEATPIHYGTAYDELSIILHTSGTTKGAKKPILFTDRAINTLVLLYSEAYIKQEKIISSVVLEFSAFFSFQLLTTSLALGHSVVLTYFGALHPKFIRAVPYYRVNNLCGFGQLFDSWLAQDNEDIDLSSLKVIWCNGSYVSPEKMKKYNEFFHARGCEASVICGYGQSETGGVFSATAPGCEEDSIGYPTPGAEYRILDENDNKFYKQEDGARTGTLYISAESMSMGRLDDEVLIEFTEIDGLEFICTYDKVTLNEDGSFSYAGRMDRYFVNNDGVRFDPGLVEKNITAHKAIDECAVAPIFDKRIHDTVPVLYAKLAEKTADASAAMSGVLADVFIHGGKVKATNLPTQCVIVEQIPHNANGKVDIFKITRDRLNGEVYDISPVYTGEELTGVRLKKASHIDSFSAGTLPNNRGASSGVNVFEFINGNVARAGKGDDRNRQNGFGNCLPFGFPNPFAFAKTPFGMRQNRVKPEIKLPFFDKLNRDEKKEENNEEKIKKITPDMPPVLNNLTGLLCKQVRTNYSYED